MRRPISVAIRPRNRWLPARRSADGVHLVDYKVRILDGATATAARTRVIIDSQHGSETWSTMGSDTNIIAASAQALADSLEYAIWKGGAELRRRDERHFTTVISGEGAR